MSDWLSNFIGIKPEALAAGLAGGSVRFFLVGGGWFAAVTSACAGALTAAYLTPAIYIIAIAQFGFTDDPKIERAMTFAVGLTGLLICETIIMTVRARLKNIRKP